MLRDTSNAQTFKLKSDLFESFLSCSRKFSPLRSSTRRGGPSYMASSIPFEGWGVALPFRYRLSAGACRLRLRVGLELSYMLRSRRDVTVCGSGMGVEAREDSPSKSLRIVSQSMPMATWDQVREERLCCTALLDCACHSFSEPLALEATRCLVAIQGFRLHGPDAGKKGRPRHSTGACGM